MTTNSVTVATSPVQAEPGQMAEPKTRPGTQGCADRVVVRKIPRATATAYLTGSGPAHWLLRPGYSGRASLMTYFAPVTGPIRKIVLPDGSSKSNVRAPQYSSFGRCKTSTLELHSR